MRKLLSNSWTLLCGTLVGIFLLMASERPDLQSREAEDGGPAKKVAIAGHVLTWSTGGVLAYRMVRSVRKNGGTHEEVRLSSPPANAASQPGEPPIES
jgi:hypothetical protein